jgi:hypothetical protein
MKYWARVPGWALVALSCVAAAAAASVAEGAAAGAGGPAGLATNQGVARLLERDLQDQQDPQGDLLIEEAEEVGTSAKAVPELDAKAAAKAAAQTQRESVTLTTCGCAPLRASPIRRTTKLSTMQNWEESLKQREPLATRQRWPWRTEVDAFPGDIYV